MSEESAQCDRCIEVRCSWNWNSLRRKRSLSVRKGGQWRFHKALDKVLESNRFIPMVFDGDAVGGGMDGAAL